MPAISSKITLTSAAQSANTVVADIDLIKGGTYAVANTSSLESINSNYLTDGQVMFVADEAVFYKLTITPANPPFSFVTTYAWSEVVLGAGTAISSSAQISALGFINVDDTGSFLTADDTGSFLTSADTSSFVLVSQTSSMFVSSSIIADTASYIDPTFISASAAAAGFGAGGSNIDTSSFITSEQTSSFIRISQTSSMFVSSSIIADTASYIDPTFISASAAASGFGAGGSNIDTSSFITNDQTSSFVRISQTSSMFVSSSIIADTASYVDPTFISASAAASGFGSGGGSSIDTSSFVTNDQTSSFVRISQTSSMFVSSSIIADTASYVDPTFISASAAAAGFGAGGSNIDTSSFITNDQTSSFIRISQTSSMSVATASYALYAVSASYEIITELSSSHAVQADSASFISDLFISASAARSGFGSGGGSSIDTSSFVTNDQTSSFVLVSDTSSFLLVSETGSFVTNDQTSSFLLVSETGSFLLISDTSSMIVSGALTASYISDTFISASAARSGFGSGGSSIDTSSFVTNDQTASFVLVNQTSSFIRISQTSSMFVSSSIIADTASYVDPTFISASAAASGFGAGGGSTPSGTISGSQQITDLGFINQSQTSSMLVGTASLAQTTNEVRFLGKGDNQNYYISFTNVSAGVLPYSAPLFTDNASGLAYNPSTNLIQNVNLLGNVTGSLFGTASYATFAENGISADGSISSSNWNISSDGVITLSPSSPTTASAGSIYFDGTDFYFGL